MKNYYGPNLSPLPGYFCNIKKIPTCTEMKWSQFKNIF